MLPRASHLALGPQGARGAAGRVHPNVSTIDEGWTHFTATLRERRREGGTEGGREGETREKKGQSHN